MKTEIEYNTVRITYYQFIILLIEVIILWFLCLFNIIQRYIITLI